MDMEGMRGYVANIIERLNRVGHHEERGFSIRKVAAGYEFRGFGGCYCTAERPCVIRYFLHEVARCHKIDANL